MHNMKSSRYPSAVEIRTEWARTVRDARSALGWTLAEIGQMVDADPSTFFRWETGSTSIPDAAKIRIAGVLGKHPAELFPWPTQRPPMPKPRQARKAVAA
jgi:transcriptional regulator with XRE-family HTH domain